MPISPLEVMRNSIVCYEGKVRRVKAVSELILLEGEKAWIGGGLMEGEPISEAWLDKFGFVDDRESSVWTNGHIAIIFNVEKKWAWIKGRDAHIEWVHQLQLIYFAIVGEHLKIPKLPK